MRQGCNSGCWIRSGTPGLPEVFLLFYPAQLNLKPYLRQSCECLVGSFNCRSHLMPFLPLSLKYMPTFSRFMLFPFCFLETGSDIA